MPIASYRAYVCGYPIPIVIGAIARPEFCRAVPQQVELRVESTALVYRSCLNIGGGDSYVCHRLLSQLHVFVQKFHVEVDFCVQGFKNLDDGFKPCIS